jgi:hypothetical protein
MELPFTYFESPPARELTKTYRELGVGFTDLISIFATVSREFQLHVNSAKIEI